MKIRRLSLFVALVLIISLVGCSGGGSASGKDAAGNSVAGNVSSSASTNTVTSTKTSLTVAIQGDPGSLNPYDSLNGSGRLLWTPVYEPLFEFDTEMNPYPCLVEGYELAADGLSITLKMRKGVKFHNGEEMKASDVAYSIGLCLDSNWGSNAGPIDRDNIKIDDDYTLTVPYKSVSGSIFYQLQNVYVLSEKHMKEVGTSATLDCIGTGSFKWKSMTSGMEYVMERNNDYWGEASKLETITMRIIPDASVAMLELESGGVDMITGVSYTDVVHIKNDSNSPFTIFEGQFISSMCVGFNCAEGTIMDNLSLRQAIAYAIDEQTILDVAYEGIGSLSTNIVASGVPSHYARSEDQLYSFDLEKAKQKLVEAGYPDGVTLEFYAQNTTMHNKLSELLINMLGKVGITLKVNTMEGAALRDLQLNTNDVPMYFEGWACNGDPTILMNLAVNPERGRIGGGTNFTRTADEPDAPEFVEILNKANSIQDNELRNVEYRKLFDIVYDNVWEYPMVDTATIFIHANDLEGFWTGGPVYHYESCYWTK